MSETTTKPRTPIDVQIDALRARFDGVLLRQEGGASIVTVPALKLPSGWSKDSTAIHFILPSGYPHANPDCFNADHDLRLANGAIPKNAQIQNLAVVGQTLWFSWHLQRPWKPNRDSLISWMGVIHSRFLDAT